MARLLRLVLPEQPQHLTQHGDNCDAIFYARPDHRLYLKKRHVVATKQRCGIHIYVLMVNQVQLLLNPQTENGIDKLIQMPGHYYAQYCNFCYQRTGAL